MQRQRQRDKAVVLLTVPMPPHEDHVSPIVGEVKCFADTVRPGTAGCI